MAWRGRGLGRAGGWAAEAERGGGGGGDGRKGGVGGKRREGKGRKILFLGTKVGWISC